MKSVILSKILASAESPDQWLALCTEIRRTRGTSCQSCRRGGVATRVHSYAIITTKLPVANDCVVLCKDCSDRLDASLKLFRRYVMRKLSPRCFEILNGALSVGLDHNDPLALCHAIAAMCSAPGSVQRFAADWTAEKPASV